MAEVNRRQVLVAGVGVVASASVGFAAWRTLSELGAEGGDSGLMGEIRRHLAGHVELSEAVYEAFEADLSATEEPLMACGLFGLLPHEVLLMSTNYFKRASDAAPIEYQTLYHPYANPCYSAF